MACSGDDSAASGGGGSTGTGGTADSTGAGGTTDSSIEATANTLYLRLGGHSGVRAALDAIVAAELMDSEIASFFVFQTTPTSGHPSATQLTECFTNQLSKAAGGPESYPLILGNDFGGFSCRDMTTIHAPFHISGATFDKFVTIAATTLTQRGVTSPDVMSIGAVLNSLKTAIVDSEASAGPFVGATLYGRLGGHTGIRSAIDHIVTAELADPTIAPFFAAQTATVVLPPHPSADQIAECLTNQLGKAAGGSESYPLTLGADHLAFTCRDMATIHQPLGISSANFDRFVVIAATTLAGLGVSNTDIATIGSVLNGTKADIVLHTDAGASDASIE